MSFRVPFQPKSFYNSVGSKGKVESSARRLQMGDGGRKVSLVCWAV